MSEKPFKVGLALSGGGAKGAFQLSVLKALKAQGILDMVSVYAGASVGALNAVMTASDRLDYAEDVWLSMDKDLFNMTPKELMERLKSHDYHGIKVGLYPTEELEQMIDDALEVVDLKNKDVYVATTCMGDENVTFWQALQNNFKQFMKGELPIEYPNLKNMPKEEVRQHLLASTAIPIFFKPVYHNAQTYVDGGVYANTPLKPLVDAGCTHIIVIDLFKVNLRRKKKVEGIPVFNFYPEHSLGRILDFDREKIRKRLKEGEHVAQKRMTELIEMLAQR